MSYYQNSKVNARHTVEVEKLSDFPKPVGGVITLRNDIVYRIQDEVDLGSNRLVVSGGNCTFDSNDGLKMKFGDMGR